MSGTKRNLSGTFSTMETKRQKIEEPQPTEGPIDQAVDSSLSDPWTPYTWADDVPTDEQVKTLRLLGHKISTLGIFSSKSTQNLGRPFFGAKRTSFVSWVDDPQPPFSAIVKPGAEKTPGFDAKFLMAKKENEENKKKINEMEGQLALLQLEMERFQKAVEDRLLKIEKKK